MLLFFAAARLSAPTRASRTQRSESTSGGKRLLPVAAKRRDEKSGLLVLVQALHAEVPETVDRRAVLQPSAEEPLVGGFARSPARVVGDDHARFRMARQDPAHLIKFERQSLEDVVARHPEFGTRTGELVDEQNPAVTPAERGGTVDPAHPLFIHDPAADQLAPIHAGSCHDGNDGHAETRAELTRRARFARARRARDVEGFGFGKSPPEGELTEDVVREKV